MKKIISRDLIDLPGAEGHRFTFKETQTGVQNTRVGKVSLERKVTGRWWVEIDSITNDAMGESAQAKDDFRLDAEAHLLEHWFSLELAKALN